MSPEIIIRSGMFDPASCPAFPAVPVKDFCLYDLPAGETACCPVPVKKSVTAVREKLQPVLPGDRAAQTGKFFMEQFQGFQQVFRKLPQEYVLCREVGAGIVPIDPMERRWREETGRLCCKLAERAGGVVRLWCGIPQWLKGGEG